MDRSETLAYVAIFTFLFLFIGYCIVSLAALPHCPYEDSCYPEYENGQWTIVEGER